MSDSVKIPILLDTDLGSDIDDAVALAYLLAQPRCELVGITTVTGQANLRASIGDAVCQAAGRTDIPIHVGVESPLLVAQRQPHATHFEALGERWPYRSFGTENTAIDFLQTTIKSRPGEISLLAIGPLTNIALLFAIYPEIPALLKEMVIMGGSFYDRSPNNAGTSEWNIICDPHAAEMVFRAPVPRLTAVGLDVTLQCTLPADEARLRFNESGGPLKLVSSMAEVWFRHSDKVIFHDPLSAALVFEPGLCEVEDGVISVGMGEPNNTAITKIVPGTGAHRAAKSVNAEAFLEHYFSITSRAQLTEKSY